jgi:NADH-quinone oxidoreductase subunit M
MWVGAIATLGIVITAAYALRLYQRTMTGPVGPGLEGIGDLRGREITALVPVAALTILLGLYPAPVLNVVNPAIDRVMSSVGATDPAPVLGSTATTSEGTQQ